MYINKIPNWVQSLYKRYTWRMPVNDYAPTVYLTFDDGPHSSITPWVLEQLAAYNAKATFFCIGKNVIDNPLVYESIIAQGHSVGNHSHTHLNAKKVPTSQFLADVDQAAKFINSSLFRPPYGSINKRTSKPLIEKGYRIILWNLIPGDWDTNVSPEDCLEKIVFNLSPGDILVLHDSEKAQRNMQYVLPKLLQHCRDKGWALEAL